MLASNYILIFEIVATLTGLVFIIGLVSEKVWAWPLGIISTFLMSFVLYDSKLYSETILYAIYTIAGFYGWYSWAKGGIDLKIQKKSIPWHIAILVAGALLAFLVAYIMGKYTDAARPQVDAITSVFGVFATILEAKKILRTWLYWIGINLVSFWLYYDREINIYLALLVIYLILSIYGYFQWRNKMESQS